MPWTVCGVCGHNRQQHYPVTTSWHSSHPLVNASHYPSHSHATICISVPALTASHPWLLPFTDPLYRPHLKIHNSIK